MALPVEDALPDLLSVLDTGRRAVLVAPPGAGKTTRIPLALLDAAWRGDGRIVMLEPRRPAARAAAAYMARSLGEAAGETVGYRVRMDSRIGQNTRIEVVTEGVFTRMILDDPELSGVAVVIFDEFHERSLDADLGLALALDASGLREDLRILVMSATIDGAGIARLLEAPVIESHGRAFPVETRHLAPPPGQRIEDAVAESVVAALRSEMGSILAFLPGQAEIRRTSERLEARLPADTDLAPLYGQLPPAEQDRTLAPAPTGRRKVVLATAIAETSLTIEGVRIVVDSGLARVPAYDPATGLTTLQTRRVSRAAADQRRGRAGRTEPGICYRLWAEGQTASLAPYDTPEILSADLAGLALDLASWGVSDPATLTFLDPPPAPAWSEATGLLRALDALDRDGRITTEGRALARLPLHPRLAHMIHRAGAEGDAETAARLAVLLSERGLGGDDTDLAHRLERFKGERGRRADDARKLAARWASLAGGGSQNLGTGRHLARAYPDRVAQQAGARGRYRLANGRAASLDETDPLAAQRFLVVTDVTGAAATGRIRGAAAIERDEIEELFAEQITDETAMSWNPRGGAVQATQRRAFGAVILAEHPAPITDFERAASLLAAATVEVDAIPWSKDQRALMARSRYLREAGDDRFPSLGDVRPDDLAPYLVGRNAMADITAADLEGYLAERLPHALRAELDRLLPSHFSAPTGSRVPIDYAAENGPALEIRVQELFGLDRHPTVAGGRMPLLLVLLSPARRPIQTTRDLPGFWRGSWKEVAKDLKGRYPRHPWPDDPLAAAATNRVKPRGS